MKPATLPCWYTCPGSSWLTRCQVGVIESELRQRNGLLEEGNESFLISSLSFPFFLPPAFLSVPSFNYQPPSPCLCVEHWFPGTNNNDIKQIPPIRRAQLVHHYIIPGEGGREVRERLREGIRMDTHTNFQGLFVMRNSFLSALFRRERNSGSLGLRWT